MRQCESTLVLCGKVCNSGELGLTVMASSIVDGDAHAPVKSRTQKLFVMRHGERKDDAEKSWVDARMWDPPLTDVGAEQAMKVGEKLRGEGVQITRILVSPFLRCVQTVAGVIKGMYPDGTDISKLKVSIEYGLAELMNKVAIRNPRDPQSTEPWHLPFEELYSKLPNGVVDTSVQSILPKLPDWEEATEEGRSRYKNTFLAVSNKFPDENVLCVSHGEGVSSSVKHLRPGVSVYDVKYCAHTLWEREIYIETSEAPSTTGPWKLMTELGPASGLLCIDNSQE